MRKLEADVTSGLLQFSQATLRCLEKHVVPNTSLDCMYAGTSKDGRCGWLVRGSSLEVVCLASGDRIASWCFGSVIKDHRVSVTCVAEFFFSNSLKLLVGLKMPSEKGMLCVFDVKKSKVVKAIDIPHKVTSVETVCSVGADDAPSHIFCSHLQTFHGIVAAGTREGHVYMIAESHSSNRFNFKKPDGSILKSYVSGDIYVSALKFVKETGTLCVGFNFGCFQLWRLTGPFLEYSSRLEADLDPVTHFAYQEPENDPRCFSYLWLGHGPMPENEINGFGTSIHFFQLSYNKKTWHDEHGYYIEELVSAVQRLELDLNTSSLFNVQSLGGRLLSCYTLEDPSYTVPSRVPNDDSFDEFFHGQDLSLCVFVWETVIDSVMDIRQYSVGLFDINRWYHAQMPGCIRLTNHDVCPFFAFCSLDGVQDTDCLLAAKINYNTIARFHSPVFPSPEQHFYPSSLAFDVCGIVNTGLIKSKFLGLQRQILSDMEKSGHESFVNPMHYYNLCMYAGLLPRGTDITTSHQTVESKREALLTLALEYNLLNLITSCVHHWATREYEVFGCNLRNFLDWAWSRVASIKSLLDRTCIPLYDCSGVSFDSQTTQLLQHQGRQLKQIITLLQTIITQTMATTEEGEQLLSTTEQGKVDLETKLRVVTLISHHLQMVLWFVGNGLLPEIAEDDEEENAFQFKRLKDLYTRRRHSLSSIHSDRKMSDLLMIDGIMDEVGDSVKMLWQKLSGDPQYPPSSLHALLNVYLLDNVSDMAKHTLVLYVMLDMIHLLSEDELRHDQMTEKLNRFGQAFSLPLNIVRLTHGFWYLDHKQFEEALSLLLDPLITSEISTWQHMRVVKAFLYQGQCKLALKYLRVRKPSMLTSDDVRLKLTVLLANGLAWEAFEYQRICRDEISATDLLSHLFLACQQTKIMDQLLQLPLDADEESHLVDYLKTKNEGNNVDLLVMHYLQRARYIEAIKLNERLKHKVKNEGDSAAREQAATRDAIVDCYTRVLPKVQHRLLSEDGGAARRGAVTRREARRTKPLSATVNKARATNVVSHAMLVGAVTEQVAEITPADEDMYSPLHRKRFQAVEDHPGPFVCTLATPTTQSAVIDTPEVVFPQVRTDSSFAVGDVSCVDSPLARPASATSFLSNTLNSPARLDTKKRLSNRYQSSEALSLLETPPVRRKTPVKKAPSAEPTPQSILKVKQGLRPLPSPHREQTPKNKNVSRVSMYDVNLPTPPRFKSRHLLQSRFSDPEVSKSSMPAASTGPSVNTPDSNTKTLRFVEPAPAHDQDEEMVKEKEETDITRSSTADDREDEECSLAVEMPSLQQNRKISFSDVNVQMDVDESDEEEEEYKFDLTDDGADEREEIIDVDDEADEDRSAEIDAKDDDDNDADIIEVNDEEEQAETSIQFSDVDDEQPAGEADISVDKVVRFVQPDVCSNTLTTATPTGEDWHHEEAVCSSPDDAVCASSDEVVPAEAVVFSTEQPDAADATQEVQSAADECITDEAEAVTPESNNEEVISMVTDVETAEDVVGDKEEEAVAEEVVVDDDDDDVEEEESGMEHDVSSDSVFMSKSQMQPAAQDADAGEARSVGPDLLPTEVVATQSQDELVAQDAEDENRDQNVTNTHEGSVSNPLNTTYVPSSAKENDVLDNRLNRTREVTESQKESLSETFTYSGPGRLTRSSTKKVDRITFNRSDSLDLTVRPRKELHSSGEVTESLDSTRTVTSHSASTKTVEVTKQTTLCKHSIGNSIDTSDSNITAETSYQKSESAHDNQSVTENIQSKETSDSVPVFTDEITETSKKDDRREGLNVSKHKAAVKSKDVSAVADERSDLTQLRTPKKSYPRRPRTSVTPLSQPDIIADVQSSPLRRSSRLQKKDTTPPPTVTSSIINEDTESLKKNPPPVSRMSLGTMLPTPPGSSKNSPVKPEEDDMIQKSSARVTRRNSRRTANKKPASDETVGPLSSGSFMMNLRSMRGSSHEPTPDSKNSSDVESIIDDNNDDINEFRFSPPTRVNEIPEEPEEDADKMASVAANSFIFSPPLTRSRARTPTSQSRGSISRRQSTGTGRLSAGTRRLSAPIMPMTSLFGETADIVNQGDTPLAAKAKVTAPVKRKTSVRKKKILTTHVSPTNSPISFIQPYDETDSQEKGPRTRAHVKRHHSMKLRVKPGSSPPKKKKVAKLW